MYVMCIYAAHVPQAEIMGARGGGAAFVTELIGGYGDQFTAAVYVGTILASSVCLGALSVLVRGGLTPAALSASGLLVVALLLVLLIPGIRYFALLVLLLSSPVERIWLRWRPAAARA